MFLKVLGSPETLFQKGFWWGAGVKPLPDKPKFEISFPFSPNRRHEMFFTKNSLGVLIFFK